MGVNTTSGNHPDGADSPDQNSGSNASVLPRREYGKTGERLSVIGLGGLTISKAEHKHARKVIAQAIEKGVNYFDVSPTYGDAELKLGAALQPHRKKVFLACKTTQRSREGAAAELASSMDRLQSDYLDLYQLHALKDMKADVDTAFGKGGAMEVLIQAKNDGRVHHLGFSAHSAKAAITAMDRYDFDSVLFPINFACYYSGDFGPQVIKRSKEKDVAILAIKAMAHEPWTAKCDPERKLFPGCGYKPLSHRRQAELGLRFVLNQPVTAAIPPADEQLFWLAVDIAMSYKPLSLVEKKEIEEWGTRTDPIFTLEQEDML